MDLDIAIVMTTCEREDPTLDRSLRSLKKSLGENYAITVQNDEGMQLGCFGAYNKALKTATAMNKDYCLVVPDDMLYHGKWSDLKQYIKDDLGFIALFTPKGLGERLSFAKGINKIDGGWATSWGSSYLMKTEVAKKVVSHPFYLDHLNGRLDGSKYFNYAKNKRIDHCIPEVMHQLGLKQLFYAPSFCQHIGYKSTIGHVHTVHENRFMP